MQFSELLGVAHGHITVYVHAAGSSMEYHLSSKLLFSCAVHASVPGQDSLSHHVYVASVSEGTGEICVGK